MNSGSPRASSRRSSPVGSTTCVCASTSTSASRSGFASVVALAISRKAALLRAGRPSRGGVRADVTYRFAGVDDNGHPFREARRDWSEVAHSIEREEPTDRCAFSTTPSLGCGRSSLRSGPGVAYRHTSTPPRRPPAQRLEATFIGAHVGVLAPPTLSGGPPGHAKHWTVRKRGAYIPAGSHGGERVLRRLACSHQERASPTGTASVVFS